MKAIIKYLCLGTLLCIGLNGFSQEINPESKPFTLRGSATVGGNLYNISGAENRQRPYGWFLNVHLIPKVYDFSFPITLVINQQQTLLTQPFYRFGISPSYKWAKLHLGYRNLYFSEFTLSGVTFLGAGVELNPGKFRFGAMYGRFQRAVELTGGNYRQPQFERMGYSVKLGVGTSREYVDLVFFKADDNAESLTVPDSLSTTIKPQANTAIGLTGKLAFTKKKRIFWNFDAGLSIFTENQNAIGSESFTSNNIASFFGLNASSHGNYAGSTELGYRGQQFSLSGKVRYVQQGYKSLGVNYLLDDLMQFTLNPSFHTKNGRLNLSGSYGLMYNNLSDHFSATTRRNIGSVNAAWSPGTHFSLSINYANFTVYQQTVRDLVYNDSLLIDQVNHTVNVTPMYRWSNEATQQSVQATFSYQQLQDNNNYTAKFSENSLQSAQLSYSISLTETLWQFRVGTNYNTFSTKLLKTTRYGGSCGISKTLCKKKLNLGVSGFYNIDQREGADGTIAQLQFNASYAPWKKHSINLNTSILNVGGATSFTEQRASISYRVSF